jgi:HAD superfamily hydrolase (TIGR01509 family)
MLMCTFRATRERPLEHDRRGGEGERAAAGTRGGGASGRRPASHDAVTGPDDSTADLSPFPPPDTIEGVLFDFHSTLVDQGDAASWIRLAWQHAGRQGDPVTVLGGERAARLATWAERIWENVREIDPHSRRDLDPESHRRVYDRLVRTAPDVDAELAQALYATLLETWIPYDDALPVLSALRTRGIRTALVSNIGIDVRHVLKRSGLANLLDAVVVSYEAGAVKPDAAIFTRALELLRVPAQRALMVGDNWRDDGGAAALGIRTLLLPRTSGASHGLDLVLRLVGD